MSQIKLAAVLLRSLHGLSVLQMLRDGTGAGLGEATGLPRYSMHLLVRELAVDLRRRQAANEQHAAVSNFVGFNLSSREQLNSYSGRAPDAEGAAKLLQLEAPNVQAMLQLLAADHTPYFRTMLEADTEQARKGQCLRAPRRATGKWTLSDRCSPGAYAP